MFHFEEEKDYLVFSFIQLEKPPRINRWPIKKAKDQKTIDIDTIWL